MFAWTRRYRKKYKNDPTYCDRCGWNLQGYGRCPECGGKVRLISVEDAEEFAQDRLRRVEKVKEERAKRKQT